MIANRREAIGVIAVIVVRWQWRLAGIASGAGIGIVVCVGGGGKLGRSRRGGVPGTGCMRTHGAGVRRFARQSRDARVRVGASDFDGLDLFDFAGLSGDDSPHRFVVIRNGGGVGRREGVVERSVKIVVRRDATMMTQQLRDTRE